MIKRNIKTIERNEGSIEQTTFQMGVYAEGHMQARTGSTAESLKSTMMRKHNKGHETALQGSKHKCLRGLEL